MLFVLKQSKLLFPSIVSDWFKGWPQFHNYNRQPNDDGLSNQDCIEMRRTFGFPTKGSGKLGGFFWNDRDCSVANPFICEKLKIGGERLITSAL